jgi:hypothetical protein
VTGRQVIGQDLASLSAAGSPGRVSLALVRRIDNSQFGLLWSIPIWNDYCASQQGAKALKCVFIKALTSAKATCSIQ